MLPRGGPENSSQRWFNCSTAAASRAEQGLEHAVAAPLAGTKRTMRDGGAGSLADQRLQVGITPPLDALTRGHGASGTQGRDGAAYRRSNWRRTSGSEMPCSAADWRKESEVTLTRQRYLPKPCGNRFSGGCQARLGPEPACPRRGPSDRIPACAVPDSFRAPRSRRSASSPKSSARRADTSRSPMSPGSTPLRDSCSMCRMSSRRAMPSMLMLLRALWAKGCSLRHSPRCHRSSISAR